MKYHEAVTMSETHLLPRIVQLYGLEDYAIRLVQPHEGGRNIVYTCERADAAAKILRIAFLQDRSREDFLGEVEYIRYLYDHGCSVSNVVSSRKGNLVEEMTYDQHPFFICVFNKAKGIMLAENNYLYPEGVPLTEYHYNCGKTLGKLHQVSKDYAPIHRRYSFFDKYTPVSINTLLPDSLPLLKQKIAGILTALAGLDRDRESFGLTHFDYNDGNYAIDLSSGQIPVYDFDNACYCWYLFDLASLWTHGVGWIQGEPDAKQRQAFMDDYFATVLTGYRTETRIDALLLRRLPLFIQATIIENIVDAFERMRDKGEAPQYDEWLAYRIKCLEDDIPYLGFFHEMYRCEAPFEYEVRAR